jgi:hypothetical protein
MATIMSHKDWMSRTYSYTKARSTLLKAVDESLKFYEQYPQHPNFLAVKENLKNWKDSKKPLGSWVSNARNSKGAVRELWDQLHQEQRLNPQNQAAEDGAVAALKEARKAFLVTLFTGTQLKSHNFIAAGQDAQKLGRKLKSSIASVKDMKDSGNAQKLGKQAFTGALHTNAWGNIKEVFQGAEFADVLNNQEFVDEVTSVIGGSLEELCSGMVAGAGLVSSSAKTIWYTYKTGKSSSKYSTLKTAEQYINPGDAQAALNAVQTLIARDIARNKSILTTHAAETGAKAGGMFLDLGAGTTAIAGLTGTIVRLLISISFMANDWKERYYANKMLKNPASIDASIFQKSPVLGCYFLASADTSIIVSLLFDDIITSASFKDVVTDAAKRLDPVLKIASHSLYAHRFRLTGKALPKITIMERATNSTGDIFYMKATGQIAMRDAGWSDRQGAKWKNAKNLRGVDNDKFY